MDILFDIYNVNKDYNLNITIPHIFSEQRVRPNTLYQELSFQDNDALGEMDEGADISGIYNFYEFFI